MAFELNHLPLVQQPDLLGQYRRQSSIDSRCMRRIIDGKDEYIELQNKVWSTLGNDPLFREFSHMNELELPLSEQRLIAWKKLVCIVQYGFLTKEEEQQDPVKVAVLDNALWAVHIPASVKFALHFTMFGRTITAMGSERHAKFMFPGGLNSKVHSLEIFGCFCLTELSHGSNALGVRTTAIYNHSRKTIVLNTPDIEAAKWWAGNLGKTATHALVFAKLM